MSAEVHDFSKALALRSNKDERIAEADQEIREMLKSLLASEQPIEGIAMFWVQSDGEVDCFILQTDESDMLVGQKLLNANIDSIFWENRGC